MAERNKTKALGREPEMITLGNEEFPVRPLVIARAREFRTAIFDTIRKGFEAGTGDIAGLVNLVGDFLDKDLSRLVTMAIPELDTRKPEWIEENVTEAELQEALAVAVGVNYPWLKKMVELGNFGAIMAAAKTTT